ncbi:MAG TPA: response regulator [Candidatus Acidoferrales bacterium]|jgi:CheY-like chemotaxis protein|nr:response regulator [Candidatus Acidoferrales bacterium]
MSDHGHHTDRRKSARGKERRNKNREVISAPVRVRGMVGPDRKFDETTTTINLSPTGILIETSSDAYYRAMRVSVTVPYQASTSVAHAEQEGRVVRIGESHKGRRTVAIALVHAIEEAAQAQPHAHAHEKKSHAAEDADLLQVVVVEESAGKTHEKASEHSNQQHSSQKAVQQVSSSGVPLILVVESEVSASEFMKSYLTSEGYEVITVRTSAEAHLVLEQRVPSLLIAAVEGEDMPGYSLCSHFKQTPRLKPVPVMLMTSSAYPSDYAKAHSIGAVVCMAKPYKRERLGHVVRLLAPPPTANQAAPPPRAADPSRHAGAKSMPVPPAPGRKFRLPSVFGR